MDNKSYDVKHALQKECEGLVRDLRLLAYDSCSSLTDMANTLEVHTDVNPDHVRGVAQMAAEFNKLAARMAAYEGKREVAAYLLEPAPAPPACDCSLDSEMAHATGGKYGTHAPDCPNQAR